MPAKQGGWGFMLDSTSVSDSIEVGAQAQALGVGSIITQRQCKSKCLCMQEHLIAETWAVGVPELCMWQLISWANSDNVFIATDYRLCHCVHIHDLCAVAQS